MALANDDAPEMGEGTGGDAPATTPAAPAVDVNSLVEQAINRALMPVGQAFQSLSARVEALNAATAPRLPADDASWRGPGIAGTTSFLDNPDAFVEAKLAQFAKDKLAPLLQPVMDDKVEANMDAHRSRFDAEFGDGTFDKVVGPELDSIVKNLPPNQAISNRHVRLALDSLKGKNFDTLMEAKMAARKARAEAPPPLMPNGRPAPGRPSLSAEELDFLASAERATGKKVDRTEWIEERELGNDEDSWRAYLDAKRSGGGNGKGGRRGGTIQ